MVSPNCLEQNLSNFVRAILNLKRVIIDFWIKSISDHVQACIISALRICPRVRSGFSDRRPYHNTMRFPRRMPLEGFLCHNLGKCFPTLLKCRVLKYLAKTDDLSKCFH